LLQPGLQQGRLTAAARDVFSSVANAILDGLLPSELTARQKVLHGLLDRVDHLVVQALPPHVQAELSILLSLLCNGVGRRTLAGLAPDWPDASIKEVQEALQSMRVSRLALRQQIYHAFQDILDVVYFSDSSNWAMLGYPGPIAI
jgi:hypothetical protein